LLPPPVIFAILQYIDLIIPGKINKKVENFRVLRLKLQEIFTIQKDHCFIFSGERNKNVDKKSVASTKILFLQKMSNSEIIMF
jgi:hypothetical protein